MKKLLIIQFCLFVTAVSFVEAKASGFQYGVNLGLGVNATYFAGGGEQAHAGFYSEQYGTGALNFAARYYLNDKWSLQSGLGFTNIGFEMGFAQNYSLIKNDHFVQSRLVVNITQLPIMAIYSFKPDCRNKRWIVGAGFNFMFAQKNANTTVYPANPADEVNLLPQLTNFSNSLSVSKSSNTAFQLMAGREKTFKKGAKFSICFLWNIGLMGNVATSTVKYTESNVNYEHVFANRGDYAGLSFSWFFGNKMSRKLMDKPEY
jgi:hypothetical protein